MIRRPPRSPLFPSTTLSRSVETQALDDERPRARLERGALVAHVGEPGEHHDLGLRDQPGEPGARDAPPVAPGQHPVEQRSEEHTSELQSRQYLVCRLLLEKK